MITFITIELYTLHDSLSLWNRDINQSNLYCGNSPSKTSLSGATAKSVFNSKIRKAVRNIMGKWACWCLWGGEAKSKSCDVSRRKQLRLLNGQVVRGCSKGKGYKSKCPCTCVGDDPESRQRDFLTWPQWTGWERCGKHGVKINRLLFTKSIVDDKQWQTGSLMTPLGFHSFRGTTHHLYAKVGFEQFSLQDAAFMYTTEWLSFSLPIQEIQDQNAR